MFTKTVQAMAWLLIVCIAGSSTDAAIFYGDFGPEPLPAFTMYLDVREDSFTDPDELPLYGPPELVGDHIDFDPSGFGAEAHPSVGLSDVIDGQLNFTVMALENPFGQVAGGYTAYTLTESGLYSLIGVVDNALVSATLLAEATVLEVDGVPLPAPVQVSASDTFSRTLGEVNADPGDSILPNDGWDNTATLDFSGVLGGMSYEFGVTKFEVVVDNRLITLAGADPPSIAVIDKKNFEGTPTFIPNPEFDPVPEPQTVALLVTTLAAFFGYRRLS